MAEDKQSAPLVTAAMPGRRAPLIEGEAEQKRGAASGDQAGGALPRRWRYFAIPAAFLIGAILATGGFLSYHGRQQQAIEIIGKRATVAEKMAGESLKSHAEFLKSHSALAEAQRTLGAQLDSLRGDLRNDGAQARAPALEANLSALIAKVQDLEAAHSRQRDADPPLESAQSLAAAISTLLKSQQAVDARLSDGLANLQKLALRLDQAERRSTAAHPSATASDNQAAILATVASARTRGAAGEPLGATVAAFTGLGIDDALLADLRPFANRPLPDARKLSQEFSRLAPVLADNPAPQGVMAKFVSNARGLVSAGRAAPGVDAVAEALRSGALEDAAAALARLPSGAREKAAGFQVELVAARMAHRSLDRLETEALLALGKAR